MPNFFPERRVTRSITVGSVKIGDKYPVSIQSMITAETRDTQSAVQHKPTRKPQSYPARTNS
jgi:4-hydroxy-3-methylbut-2-en-1-yl diphosphate synthase IspG/GcpE